MTEPEFTFIGSEVRRNGQTFAYCNTKEIAWALCHILNGEVLMDITDEEADRVQAIIWP